MSAPNPILKLIAETRERMDELHNALTALDLAGGSGSSHEVMISAVCEAFDVSRSKLLSKRRTRPVVRARCALAHLLITYAPVDKQDVAQVCRYKSQSSVLYAAHRAEILIREDDDFCRRLERAIEAVEANTTKGKE